MHYKTLFSSKNNVTSCFQCFVSLQTSILYSFIQVKIYFQRLFMQQKEWFKEWFNTTYYHILYQNRNDQEAEFFINHLLSKLNVATNSHVLDLACGKGRHARYMASKGLQVTGLDLSEQSIKYAQQFIDSNLHFDVHDMRQPYQDRAFHFVFNFFTSFGYFNTLNDNLATLQAIHFNLKDKGIVVIDFLNANQVINNLVRREQKILDDVTFNITRKVENGIIIKQIIVNDPANNYHRTFEERVQALYLKHFKELLQKANFHIIDLWGNYELEDFNEQKHKRLIVVGQKV